MKSFVVICFLSLCIAWPATALQADIKQIGQPNDLQFDMLDHQPIGRPAEGSLFTETIELTIEETASGYMLFKPDAIHIEKGSVVRFVINNQGALSHEFFLGSFDEVSKHERWMRNNPEMEHDGANAVAVSSGTQAELLWEFSSIANLEFVCLLPGHREAGMWGVIMVHDHLAPKRKK